jgi:V/A-type H+-transporting ATPase subunit C
MYFNGVTFKDNSDYSYSCAKIRALENKLLTKSDFVRFLDMNLNQIPQILSEKNYQLAGRDGKELEYFDILSAEWKNVVSLVKDLLPSGDITKLLLMRYDFLNLKVLIKDTLRREKVEQGLLDDSDSEIKLFDVANVEPEELKTHYWEGNYDRFPEYMKDAITSYEGLENITPADVDILVDKVMYKEILNFAKDTKNDFLIKYYTKVIDLKNLLNLFRLKSLDKEFKDYQKIIMEGGDIDISSLSRLYADSMDMIVAKLHFVDYYNALKEGYDFYLTNGSLSEMERLFDNWIIEYIKVCKMISFGPESVIGYFFAKENEIKNLRIVLTGLENNLEKNQVIERLRENYV